MNRIKLIITIIFICCGTLIADISKHDQTLLNELELLQLHELYIYKVNTLSKTSSETDLQFYKTKATLSQFKLDAINGHGHGIDEVILLYKQLCLQQLTIWEHYRSFDYTAVNKVCKIMINKQNIQLLYWIENICRLQIEQLKSQLRMEALSRRLLKLIERSEDDKEYDRELEKQARAIRKSASSEQFEDELPESERYE